MTSIDPPPGADAPGGTILPGAVRSVLQTDLATIAAAPMPVFALLTVRPDGWPHVAYLGPGELLDLDGTRLALATWAASRSTQAAVRTGKAALQVVLDGTPVVVRLQVSDLGQRAIGGRELRLLDGKVVGADADAAPYATLRSGTTFTVDDPAREVTRWERTRSALREAVDG